MSYVTETVLLENGRDSITSVSMVSNASLVKFAPDSVDTNLIKDLVSLRNPLLIKIKVGT